MSEDEKYFDGMPESYWREKRERQASPASPCSSIALNFRGDPSKPHDICLSDYDKLKAAGFLWEFYPDAPDVFPTNGKDMPSAGGDTPTTQTTD